MSFLFDTRPRSGRYRYNLKTHAWEERPRRDWRVEFALFLIQVGFFAALIAAAVAIAVLPMSQVRSMLGMPIAHPTATPDAQAASFAPSSPS